MPTCWAATDHGGGAAESCRCRAVSNVSHSMIPAAESCFDMSVAIDPAGQNQLAARVDSRLGRQAAADRSDVSPAMATSASNTSLRCDRPLRSDV